MIVEYVGLTQEAASLIEGFRKSPTETKSDIIVRVMGSLRTSVTQHPGVPKGPKVLDLGQGAKLYDGEELLLFLSEDAKRSRQPHAKAEVRGENLYMEGKKIKASKGSVLQPPMHLIQKRLNHRNDKGEIKSLSAWRQWHVVRDGQLLAMVELKDPAQARRRGRKFDLSGIDLKSLDI